MLYLPTVALVETCHDLHLTAFEAAGRAADAEGGRSLRRDGARDFSEVENVYHQEKELRQ
jgi:hypothetical protein